MCCQVEPPTHGIEIHTSVRDPKPMYKARRAVLKPRRVVKSSLMVMRTTKHSSELSPPEPILENSPAQISMMIREHLATLLSCSLAFATAHVLTWPLSQAADCLFSHCAINCSGCLATACSCLVCCGCCTDGAVDGLEHCVLFASLCVGVWSGV